MNIILCGLPGSGKSTIGRLTAEKIGYNFYDLDRLIEEAYFNMGSRQKSCRAIYLTEGEPFFRFLEKQVIRSLAIEHSILALGGGSLINQENRLKVKKLGKLIYLRADPELLYQRITKQGLPAYLPSKEPKKAFFEIVKKRSHLFESHSDLIINTQLKSADEILEILINHKDLIYGQ